MVSVIVLIVMETINFNLIKITCSISLVPALSSYFTPVDPFTLPVCSSNSDSDSIFLHPSCVMMLVEIFIVTEAIYDSLIKLTCSISLVSTLSLDSDSRFIPALAEVDELSNAMTPPEADEPTPSSA